MQHTRLSDRGGKGHAIDPVVETKVGSRVDKVQFPPLSTFPAARPAFQARRIRPSAEILQGRGAEQCQESAWPAQEAGQQDQRARSPARDTLAPGRRKEKESEGRPRQGRGRQS